MPDQFELYLKPPFSFPLSMGVWLRHPKEQVDVITGNKYSRLFFVEDKPVVLTIEAGGTIQAPVCLVRVQGESFPGRMQWAREMALHILNDDADIQGFYQHLQKNDTQLLEQTRFLQGLKPVQTPTLFETLVFAIVGQQVNVNFAYQCRVAMENIYARKAEVDGVMRVAALAPRDLENADVEQLRQLKISRTKGRAIIRLAQAFCSGELPEIREMKKLPEPEIDKRLLAQYGVGPWTVEYAKIRALGFCDSWPAGDAGLRAALERFYSLEEKLTQDKIETLGEKWRPYRSWATYYLWTWLGQREKIRKKQ